MSLVSLRTTLWVALTELMLSGSYLCRRWMSCLGCLGAFSVSSLTSLVLVALIGLSLWQLLIIFGTSVVSVVSLHC